MSGQRRQKGERFCGVGFVFVRHLNCGRVRSRFGGGGRLIVGYRVGRKAVGEVWKIGHASRDKFVDVRSKTGDDI